MTDTNVVASQARKVSDGLGVQPREVRVWQVHLGERRHSAAVSVLSETERQRMVRLRRQADRDGYAAAHAALRLIVSGCAGVDPRSICIAQSDCTRCGEGHGKPHFVTPRHFEFSISHCGDVALLALTRGVRVGVDVERIDRCRSRRRLVNRYFAPLEAAHLDGMEQEDQAIEFARLWTRKEAYLKGTGEGLLGLKRGPETWHDFVRSPRGDSWWRIADLGVCAGHAAAVAVASTHCVAPSHVTPIDLSERLRG